MGSHGKLCRCCFVTNPRAEEPAYPDKKLLTRAMESFYDNCAAYNLRYVPYRTMNDQACVQTVVKDFVVLFCFLATSLVVFLTILCRIAMHLCGLCLEGFVWAKDTIRSYYRAHQKRMLARVFQDHRPADCPRPEFCAHRNRPQ